MKTLSREEFDRIVRREQIAAKRRLAGLDPIRPESFDEKGFDTKGFDRHGYNAQGLDRMGEDVLTYKQAFDGCAANLERARSCVQAGDYDFAIMQCRIASGLLVDSLLCHFEGPHRVPKNHQQQINLCIDSGRLPITVGMHAKMIDEYFEFLLKTSDIEPRAGEECCNALEELLDEARAKLQC